jgi:F-type H+-transporting ATPase subunit delta
MSSYRVARRYAEAAIDLAEEQKQADRLAGDLELLQSTLKESRDLVAFLKSPVIPKEKRRAILAVLFHSKVSALTLTFLNMLIEKGREDALAEIIEEFFRLRDDRLGIVTIHVRAATEMTKDQQRMIVSRFEGITQKKVRIAFSVDKQLKGGFVARVGDTMYDGSVRRQLELLRERLAEQVGRN